MAVATSPHTEFTTTPDTSQVWSDIEAQFYLNGMSQSDYAQRVGGRLRELIGLQRELLDVGAGGGTMGLPLLAPKAHWTAIEPNQFLANHLREHAGLWPYQLRVMQARWQQLSIDSITPHESSLAANTCGPVSDTRQFWHWLRARTRNVMAWVLPAQNGPRGICLAGFLPSELHGEASQPAHENVLLQLGNDLRPHHVDYVDWTFHYRFTNRESAEQYFQQRFHAPAGSQRARTLSVHLDNHLIHTVNGCWASAPKRSACFIWNLEGAPQ